MKSRVDASTHMLIYLYHVSFVRLLRTFQGYKLYFLDLTALIEDQALLFRRYPDCACWAETLEDQVSRQSDAPMSNVH